MGPVGGTCWDAWAPEVNPNFARLSPQAASICLKDLRRFGGGLNTRSLPEYGPSPIMEEPRVCHPPPKPTNRWDGTHVWGPEASKRKPSFTQPLYEAECWLCEHLILHFNETIAILSICNVWGTSFWARLRPIKNHPTAPFTIQWYPSVRFHGVVSPSTSPTSPPPLLTFQKDHLTPFADYDRPPKFDCGTPASHSLIPDKRLSLVLDSRFRVLDRSADSLLCKFGPWSRGVDEVVVRVERRCRQREQCEHLNL